jgi:undecaprenyl-diphosphatase
MTPSTLIGVDWISEHVLSVWATLLVVALVRADVAWQCSQRRRKRQAKVTGILRPAAAVAVTVAALAIATAVAIEVRAEAALTVFDTALASALRDNLPRTELHLVALLSQSGNGPLLGTVAACVLVTLLWRRHWQLAVAWCVALVGSVAINSLLKGWFQRERPFRDHGFIVATGYSFPSGHALGSMVFFSMLAYVVVMLAPPRFHRASIMAAVTMISLIGMSRVLLQVHYLSDVIAGYAIGLAWATLCMGTSDYVRMRRSGRLPESIPQRVHAGLLRCPAIEVDKSPRRSCRVRPQ